MIETKSFIQPNNNNNLIPNKFPLAQTKHNNETLLPEQESIKPKSTTEEVNKIDPKQQNEKKNRYENLNTKLSDITSITEVYFQFEFSKEDSKEIILKVVDKETNEVINQYPSDVSLKIMQMVEQLFGRGQLSDVSI